jgi:hypothetical protein
MPKINDLDLKDWKNHQEVLTDSLWLIPERDNSGAHNGRYWGNFIPQIPRQMMLRYTKRGDVVLDTFLGSGTTLIECKRLGRHGVGVELIPQVAEEAKKQIALEGDRFDVATNVVRGDSRLPETREVVREALNPLGVSGAQLIIMHPPYHDIIKFSNNPRDLCNAKTTEEFLQWFQDVVENFSGLLEKGRYLCLVIGDKYSAGKWVPLGFYTMQRVLDSGYDLKSIVVKNMAGNRAKLNREHLWRYRALVGGFYIFKHEYVMVFKKK